ncbi:MAG: DMT family transporter [Dehalococcoidia bacterium]|nr:DMT family transporter [Dehalococcoidia bacterium]
MLIGEAFALVNAVLWALTGIFIKRAGPGVKTAQIMLAQNWFAALAAVLMAAVTGTIDDAFRMPGWVAGLLAGGAVLNAGGQFLFFSALRKGNVGVVYTTTTGLFIVLSLAASALFLGDTINLVALAGAPIIIAGLYVMNILGGKSADGSLRNPRRETLIALGLGMVTAAVWTIGLLTTARAVRETDIWSAALVRNTVPALIYMPVAFMFPNLAPWKATARVRFNLVASSFFFVVSYMTFLYSITKISPGLSALLSSTSPVFALALSAIALKEKLTKVAIIGAGLSLVGMAVVLASR